MCKPFEDISILSDSVAGNLYITTFSTPVIVKYLNNNLVIAKIFYQSFGPSLYGDPTVAVLRLNSGENDFAREIENIMICLGGETSVIS